MRAPSSIEAGIRAFVHDPACTFEKLSGVWSEIESYYGVEGIRALGRVDRFYLLTRICGREDALNPWVFARCREVERDPDGYLDLWAREHYKSTIITFAGSIQEVLNDPDITIGIFSHTRPDAQKFVQQLKTEFETNRRLIALYPEIFWDNPEKDSPLWSIEKGIIVKRASNAREATIEGHGIVDSQPVGAHFRLMVIDDLVTAKAVSTPDQVKKTTDMDALADSLGARGPDGLKRKWRIGTRYSYADPYQAQIDAKLVKLRIYPATDDGTMDGTPVYLRGRADAAEPQRRHTGAVQARLAAVLGHPAVDAQRLHPLRPREFAEAGLGLHGDRGHRLRREPQHVPARRLPSQDGAHRAVAAHQDAAQEVAPAAGRAVRLRRL
jgi:hypothetical protein